MIVRTVSSQVSAAMTTEAVKSQPLTSVSSRSSSEVPSASSILPATLVPPPLRRVTAASPSTVFHYNILCHGCDMNPIAGTRYKSTRKDKYDLCLECFKKADDQEDYISIECPLNLPRLLHVRGIRISNLEVNEENDRKCRDILEHLRFNQVLRSMDLAYSTYFGSIESCKVLGEVVGRSTTLCDLSLHGVGLSGDGLEYIVRGLLSNPNSALVRLEIGSNIKLGTKGAQLVEELLLRNIPTLETLGIWGSGFSPEETAPVARALAKNKTLHQLTCGVGYDITHPDKEGPLSSILRAFTPVDKLTSEQALYQDGTYNQTVQTLGINYEKGIEENLVKMLTHNSSLRVLGLRFFQFNREEWGDVWKVLKHDKVVHTMDLYRCGEGLGNAFVDLMELLQANRTLKSIRMGETPLVRSGQSSLVQKRLESSARLANERIIVDTTNGCLSREILQTVLEGFIASRNYSGFTSGDLIELMKELELCYEVKSERDAPTRSYFIPSTISDPDRLAREGIRRLEWTVQGTGRPIHSGRRLQCTDQSRTFLSPGFFQRFQVHLQTFLQGLKVEYQIEINLIRMKNDGLELLVEKSGDSGVCDGDYVDILAKSYSPGLNGHHLYRNVVEELRKFCASREGCPGVALQEAIVRPGCVERLTLCCHRKNQAVVKETLKQEVIKKFFDSKDFVLWKDGTDENSVPETSQIYKHEFEAVPYDRDLPNEWIEGTTMLGFLDVEEAILKYRTTIEQKRSAIVKAVDDVQSVTSDGPTRYHQPDGLDSLISYQNDTERRNQDPIARQLKQVQETIISRLDAVEANIVWKIEQQQLLLRHIAESFKDMQTLHSTLIEKLDQVMGFTAELQDIPGMPYFSYKNMGMTQRLVAFIQIGKPLNLHFMCENPNRPHSIDGQKGWPLVKELRGDAYKKLRPLILGSIKVLFILVKAGLHVTAGIGNAIPDFTSLPGAMPLQALSLTGESLIENIKNISSTAENSEGTLADAWGTIRTIVGPIKERGQIAERFQLHQVKFKSAMLSRYYKERHCFWLCNKCRYEAREAEMS